MAESFMIPCLTFIYSSESLSRSSSKTTGLLNVLKVCAPAQPEKARILVRRNSVKVGFMLLNLIGGLTNKCNTLSVNITGIFYISKRMLGLSGR